MSGVSVRGLSRAYEDEYALVGLDAEFPVGTVTAVLGPNGAGKSTLLQLLSLLSEPTEGALFFGREEALGQEPLHRAKVGYVGHQTMLYTALSGRQNLVFFGGLYRVSDLEQRVESLLACVGLTEDADRPVREYSRGMKQRLTIARALLPRPKVLLLDEPFTGLDQRALAQMIDLFSTVKREGAVVVLVSHDLKTANLLADRALILRRGRKVFEGPTSGDLATLYNEIVVGPVASGRVATERGAS